MGQYYHIAMKIDGKVIFNSRKYKGSDYVMAKLMEHSWWKNPLLCCVANEILHAKTPVRLMWVGDYAEDDEIKNLTNGEVSYKDVWEDESNHQFEGSKVFGYDGKYFINHTKKVYFSFRKYLKNAKETHKNKDWVINPISLLTAVGNGRGGGDYFGKNEDMVGTWAWDEISISTNPPEGYTEIEVDFDEE